MSKGFERREFLKTAILGTGSLFLGGSRRRNKKLPSQDLGKKPNFLFIIIDDLGWTDLGCFGSKFYETPNIDNLADKGMIFTNAYANAPNCAPTRASLLSGQYTPRHGIYTVASPARGPAHQRKLIPIPNKRILDSGIVTIPEALKPAGYVSAHIGKWHLGDDPDSGPLSQGFDLNIGGYRMGHPKSYFSPYQIEALKDGPEGEYLTDRLTEEALTFIDQNRNQPFFLYLSHYGVHTPIQAKKELIEKYRQKTPTKEHYDPVYAAMIESVDEGIGRVLEKLDEMGLADNTVVFFFSDNGGRGPPTSMEPLRGAKGMLYEGGIRVPMIVRWPGRIEAGSVCHDPVIGIDFYPTILETADVTKSSGHVIDGESLIPLLTQTGTLSRDTLFWHFPAYLEAYKGGKITGPWRTTPAGAVRQGDWKLMEFFEDGSLELYNLKEDIGEIQNLAGSLPEKAKALYGVLLKWRETIGAPVPTVENPQYDPESQ